MRSFRPSFVCQGWLGSFLRRKRWGLSAWLPALLLVPPIPSPLGTTPIRRFIWPRQANLPSYLLYITRGLSRQELIVLHNTGLPAGRVLAAAEAFQVVPGPALWDSSELHRARPLGGGWRMPLCQKQDKNCPHLFSVEKTPPHQKLQKESRCPGWTTAFLVFSYTKRKFLRFQLSYP